MPIYAYFYKRNARGDAVLGRGIVFHPPLDFEAENSHGAYWAITHDVHVRYIAHVTGIDVTLGVIGNQTLDAMAEALEEVAGSRIFCASSLWHNYCLYYPEIDDLARMFRAYADGGYCLFGCNPGRVNPPRRNIAFSKRISAPEVSHTG